MSPTLPGNPGLMQAGQPVATSPGVPFKKKDDKDDADDKKDKDDDSKHEKGESKKEEEKEKTKKKVMTNKSFHSFFYWSEDSDTD